MKNNITKNIQRFFLYTFSLVIIGQCFLQVEFWPFTDYRVFRDAARISTMDTIYRLGILDERSNIKWVFTDKKRRTNLNIQRRILSILPLGKIETVKFLKQYYPLIKRLHPNENKFTIFEHKVSLSKTDELDIKIKPLYSFEI